MKARRNKALALIILLAAVCAGTGSLHALGPAPYPTGPIEFKTYEFQPDVVRPGEKSRFEFSWNGISAASAIWVVNHDPDRKGWICARGDGKTIGAAALLYRANDWVSSCMKADTLKPDRYRIQIRESLDYYDMSTSFDHEQGTADRKKDMLAKTTTRSFEFSNSFCPVSAAILVRSLPWNIGEERGFEIIDGNERHLLVIKAAEEGEITVPAGTFAAVRLEPSIFELPGERHRETARYFEKQENKDNNRAADMRAFTMWIQKDPPRQFLKIRSEVYFGHVDMDLVEYSPGD